MFLDIETVSSKASYDELPEKMKFLWNKKAKFIAEDGQNPSEVYNKAGIFAEFGKIVCISVGLIFPGDDKYCARIKSFAGDDEKALLQEFNSMLINYGIKKEFTLCAHNGKEFDFPYLCRRMLINCIKIPGILDISGKKPWEIAHLDTLDMWKFGDRKSFTSLELLASIFGIESSKDDIDGSMVNSVYYQEHDLEKIARYCKQDVVVTAQLYLKLLCQSMVDPENIVIL